MPFMKGVEKAVGYFDIRKVIWTMRYVISDIHGCKKEYLQLLNKIQFSDQDHLYILGDILDRGFDPIGVLQDVMKRKNVTFILGNHEYLFWYFIKTLGFELSNFQSEEEKLDFRLWIKDGGLPTLDGFIDLPATIKKQIFEFISNTKAYEVLENEGKKYILVHAGITEFKEEKPLDQYQCLDFIYERIDYSERYYKDENTFIISGHTPTSFLRTDKKPEVFRQNGHIAIDCGCVYGGKLAAYCIETGDVVYV